MTAWHPDWETRWQQAKDTALAKECLVSIAAEALNNHPDIWVAAFDAATRPDERDEHVSELEAIFAGIAEAEAFARECEAYEMRTGKDWTSSERLCALEQDTFSPEPFYAAAHLASMSCPPFKE